MDFISAERALENGAPSFNIDRPKSMHIGGMKLCKDRPLYSIAEFVIYQIGRKLFVSIWFYFFPIIVLCIMYLAPAIKKSKWF